MSRKLRLTEICIILNFKLKLLFSFCTQGCSKSRRLQRYLAYWDPFRFWGGSGILSRKLKLREICITKIFNRKYFQVFLFSALDHDETIAMVYRLFGCDSILGWIRNFVTKPSGLLKFASFKIFN